MRQSDINTRTRRRLLIAAPGAAALVLATREQGRAKSSLAKARKRRKARVKSDALNAMSADLLAFDRPIEGVQAWADAFKETVGGEDIAVDLQLIADELRLVQSTLGDNLAIARGEAPSA